MIITYANIHFSKSGDGNIVYGPKGNKPTKIYGPMLVENIVQALARGVIADAEVRLHKAGYTACLQVHDELVFTVPSSDKAEACLAIKAEVERLPRWLTDLAVRYGALPIEAELGVGENYLDAK
jgi:hypothetical protein